MMKRKGFTLIELLAVIVILAIITIIAVPKIMNVIESSKKSAAESSAELYIDAIEKGNALSGFNSDYKKIEDGQYEDVTLLDVKVKGEKPESGTITITNQKVVSAQLCINEYIVTYENNKAKATRKCISDVKEISINNADTINKELMPGGTILLETTSSPDNVPVNYKSSDEKIATVSNEGLVTAVGTGTVTITAYYKKVEEQIELTVIGPDIYVSTDGNDETGDGTLANPYKSLSTAVANAEDDDMIFIKAGTYDLNENVVAETASIGITDDPNGIVSGGDKKITIFGENEKTILIFDGSKGSKRDANAIGLFVSESVLRNLVYVYKPAKNYSYANAIYFWTRGKTENVFFIIDNSSKLASYDYYNGASLTHTVLNCTFYHTGATVSKNYSGSGIYTNIATNANPTGTLTNVINESFTTETTDYQKIIEDSKNNEAFNNAQAGVFYGENAWR